ncbi:hypothetical protein JCM21900_001737 [Sporobolomyces salmonicolor]
MEYCSDDCSRRDWKDHRPWCKSFAALRRTAPLPPPLQPSASIPKRRELQRKQWLLEDDLLQAALKRDPTPLEAKLLWREPRCGMCWDREADVEARKENSGFRSGWRVCKGCRVTAWCCDEHEAVGRERHLEAKDEDGRSQCQTVQLSNEIDEFLLRNHLASPNSPPSLWVPTRVLPRPTPLPASWTDYLAASGLPKPTPPLAEIYGVFVEALSPVLTLLAALRRLGFPDSASILTVYLLDETHETCAAWLPAFEELQHQLPLLRDLRLVTVAPAAAASNAPTTPTRLPVCPACIAAGRTRTISHESSFPSAPPPAGTSIALALNSSLSLADPASSSPSAFWPRTLAALLSTSTPLLITAPTREDAQDSVLQLRAAAQQAHQDVDAVWDVERNVWAGGWPRVDGFAEDGCWKNHGWWAGVRRSQQA